MRHLHTASGEQPSLSPTIQHLHPTTSAALRERAQVCVFWLAQGCEIDSGFALYRRFCSSKIASSPRLLRPSSPIASPGATLICASH